MTGELGMALEELLRKAQMSEDVDFLHEGVRVFIDTLLGINPRRCSDYARPTGPR